MIDEEEKKKRMERAKQISNSINQNNYSSNFNNIALNRIKANSEEEQAYIDKFQRAREITNSINPRENVLPTTISEEDKIKSQQNAEKFMELIDKNVEKPQITTENIQEPSVDNNKENDNLKTDSKVNPEQQKENFENYIQNKKSSMETVSNVIKQNAEENKKAQHEKQTLIQQINEQFKRQNPSTVKPIQNNIQQGLSDVSLANNNAIQNAKVLKSGDMYKLTDGQVDDRNKLQKSVDSVTGLTGNILMGVESVIPNIVRYMDSAGETATRKAGEYIFKEIFNTDENSAKIVGDVVFSKLWEFNEIAKVNNELNSAELMKWRRETISKNTTKMSTPLGKKVSQILPSVGQNIIPMVVSYFNPLAGTTLFITSASGSYLEDAESRGMNKDQALTYSTIMGLFEGLTEQIISGKMLSNSMKLFKGSGLSNEILNSFGVSTAENFLQEAIIEPLQEAVAQGIGGKDKANWNNILNRTVTAGLDGVLSSILLGGASVGISSAVNVVDKKNVTDKEMQKAIFDTINSGKIDINSIINGATDAIKDSKFYINTEKFFINETNENNQIIEVLGTQIESINPKLNIQPAVVKKDNSFIIIDAETGLKLDTSSYISQTDAIKNFNDKIRNIDTATIKNINNKITQAKLSLINKLEKNATDNELLSKENATKYLNNKGIDFNLGNRPYLKKELDDIINAQPAKTNQKQSANTFYSNKTKYAVPDIKKVTEPFETQQEYSKEEISKIWNYEIVENEYDVIYDTNNNIKTYIAIEEEGYEGKYFGNHNTDVLVVNQYDNEDNIVKSEIIHGENGKYNAETIKNAIEKISSLYDENKPIEGQIDIEGNSIKYNKQQNTKQHERTFVFEINKYKEESKQKNIIANNILEINNNILEGISKKKQSNFLNEYLKYEVRGHDYYINSQKIIANNTTIGKLKNGKTNFSKKVETNIRYELKANIIGNLESLIKISNIYQKDRPDTKDHSFADTFDRRKSIIKYKNQNYEVMFEIGKKNNINTLYSIENIKKIGGVTSGISHYETSKTPVKGGKSTQPIDSISQKTKSVKNDTNTNTIIDNKSMQKEINNTNIQDFGEKIGGARKDLSQPKSVIKTTKEIAHNYTVTNTENGFSVNFKNKILKDGFKTQADAEQYILDFKENIKNNMAFVQEKHSLEMSENKYSIYLRNPRTLKSEYIGKGFNNKSDAESYAIALSMYLKEHGKNLFRPEIQKVERINPNIKNATKTTGNDILNNFGFKGGEFGNWVNQSERQEFLNYAQNAFTDLAIALDMEATSLGQNNQMNIAFGARGKGLTGAVAHFEPAKRVINMTRLKGAGSLAHEYGHSIDNYLSRVSGYNDDGMATTNLRNPKLSDNMKKAINNVVDSIKYNISTNQEDINKKNAIYEKNRISSLDYHLQYVDKVFSGKATTYKYNRKTKNYENIPIQVTEEQKRQYKKIRKTLEDGKVSGDYKIEIKSQSSFSTVKVYPEPVSTLQDLYKKVVGSKLNDDTVYGIYRNGKLTKQVTEVKSESAFLKSARELDKATGRATAYFSKTEEMWARAFEAYVADKLKEKGITNTYLVHSVNNSEYALFNPFPAGEERKNINKAFDNLIQVMKEEKLFKERNINTHNFGNNSDIRSMKKGNTKFIQNKKVVDNNTTVDKDLSFTKKAVNKDKVTDKTQRNAERGESYIEKEIKKIESTGNWDNNIPVTKMSDIRKTIENYLGLGIKKGHFRQQAYAIYKGNRDVIRTKELKDMDSILHETGHALDIGNRLNVDKESIADELLTAIDKLGGYEGESRTIRLEEGFAEVIREYTIIPEQAKIEYPQTVAVIQKIRQNDKSFDNFISKVQQQTYNYIHQNPRNRALSNMSIGEKTDKQPLTLEWIKQEVMRNVYDSDYVIKSIQNELAKKKGKTSNSLKARNNIYLLTRLANASHSKAISMLSEGYINLNGNKTMPGLNKIGEILGDNPERYNDLRAYLVAQRDLEYKSKTLKTGIRTMDSKTIIEQFKNDKQIQEAAKIVYDTLDGVLQYAIDNHLIDSNMAENLRKSNTFYVPMQRVLENDKGNKIGHRGAVANIMKKRTGSELDIKDVLENIVTNSANIIQQIDNNNALKALYNQGEEIGITGTVYDVISTPMIKVGTANLAMWENELKKQGVNTNNLDLEKTIDIFVPDKKIDTKNLITSFIDDNGKRIYLQFNDELTFNAVTGMDKQFMSSVLKINAKMNMPLRYGATMANLGFAIPNMISDTAQASIFSTAGFIPIIDNAIGVLDVLTANNKSVKNFMNKVAPNYVKKVNLMYSLYNQSGATSSTRMSQYRKSAQEMMENVYGTKSSNLGIEDKFKPLKRLLDILTYIPEISEQSTRLRVFEKNYDYYKNKGTSEMDSRIMAAIEARDATQDFSRTGNLTREINQLIPFSAARVGSAYTFAEKVKANPKQVSMRIAILTALAMTIKAIGYDDDEIQELNQRKKDDNFVLKIGEQVITIKKPQGILRSIINLAEYIQDLATGNIEEGKEGERLGEWLNNAIMDNMPADQITGLVPNMVAPLIENAINKDFYYNTDIVKSYDLELPDAEQYYDYNSQLAIWLGKAFNYSPAKIDNLISGYFAGLGTTVTDIMDYILGKTGITAEQPEMGAEDNAVGKRFFVNVNSNSSSVDEIYNRKTELTKLKNGGTITAEETKELETITDAISNLSNLNKQIKEIKKDLSMSGKEKAEKIKLLQQEKTDTARKALGKEVIYPENESKIQSIQFYPNDTLKKSGYTLILSTEQKKEYEQFANSYYSKYEQQGLYSKEKLEDIKSKAKEYAKNEMFKKYKSQLVKTKK